MKRLLAVVLSLMLCSQAAWAGSVYVTEFAGIAIGPQGVQIQVALEPPLADQKLTSSGAASSSSAFNAKTRFVRVATDAIICLQFGTAPTATTSTRRMAADQVEYFAVPLAASFIVSVITCT